ncbi:hypothetical protein Rhopal_006538-T1 [Rhodotorula paludigena]|uniref:non-specific serine/threonine protein kinase n=1 Tax=Rhodotorula paludigena TaxID=86838 RepID=A0AAV5GLL7_9BASI|nr:hypothetical protein Rhopal_006538-T1 [Rhodotorula paludigena]
MEDPQEVQEREIEVLQGELPFVASHIIENDVLTSVAQRAAIYGEDFEKAESRTAWKTVNAAHEFKVCVRPVEEDLKDKVHVWVHFKLPQKYPKVAPTMSLEGGKGLSSQHLSHLLSTLQREASTRLGDEMLYELCTQAATYITERHIDSVRGAQPSLEDQRRKRGEEQAKAKQEAKDRAQALKEQQEAEEAARLSQLISEDVRRKEELRLERERRERELDRERENALLEVDANGERKVKMALSRGQEKSEVTVRFGFPTSGGKRKLGKIEADLDRIHALQHPHLHPVSAYRIVRYSPSFFPPNPQAQRAIRSGEGWTVLIAVPPIRAQSLDDLLSTVGELRPDRALTYFTQLVSAVEHLHLHNVVHRAIRPKAIYVASEKGRASEGGEAGGVRLSGAGWYRRLIDLNKAEPWLIQPADEELPESWTSPEAVNAPFTYDRARDMFELGVVLAQMLFGLDVVRKYPSPAEVIRYLPRNSPSILKRVLTDLLLTEGKKRPTASRLAAQLAEHSGSSTSHGPLVLSTTPPNPLSGWHQLGNAQKALTPLVSPPPTTQLSRSVEGPSGFFWQPRNSGSRYRSEFEELEFLGRGGGGQVVKARNRLDGHLYAVKKIRLPSDKASEAKILREVTIWSRMNHPNIVRYHTSWTEFDEAYPSFGALDAQTTNGTGATGMTGETGTESEAVTEESTETDDDSDASDSVVDFDEDSTPGAELDIDFGDDFDDNIDFLSVGHAQSHSVSYPSIHFGNEDDPSAPGSREDSPTRSKREVSKKRGGQVSPTLAAPKQTRTLYIQMEYVEKLTLRETIEDGLSEVDSWRLLFQILSAMLHFTSLNIIHRDLKPSNIFIDVKGDVRIGDFGLAVNEGGGDPADVFLSVENSMDETDLTSGVGTSLYIAPEMMSRGRHERSVKYSNKIDMYSLGIVFFEMWHPFKTGMERIQVLHALRRPDVTFPPTWDRVKLARHTKIVQACLTHNPELRPSPKDLLASDLLPPRVGDDSIEETIRLLSHSGTTHAQTLISALFNQSDEDRLRKDFSYDFYDGQGAKVDNDPYAQLVHDKLSRIFRQKGAVQMDSPLLMPHSQVYASRKPVRLLDSDGTIVCLPFQLNIPFCRMVARDTSLTRLKRWTIAPVFRPSPAGGQPRSVLNAAFDIVSDAIMPAMEAECLFVIEEILGAFPLTGKPAHVINHSKILDAILDVIPSKHREAVCEILVQHGRLQRTWAKTSSELFKLPGITRAMCDVLGAVDVSGDLNKMRALVLATVPRLKHVVQEGFDELKDIVSLCHQMGMRNLRVSPLLATNYDLHRDGTIFESHVVRGKTRDVIAAGGRFDEVVSRLAAPEVRFSGRCPHVVGFSLAIARLSLAAAEANATAGKHAMMRKDEHLRSYGQWAIRRCDVYVVSFSPGLIDLRLDIVKDLWKAGIKADLMYDDDFLTLTPEQLVNACRREGILWLVIVKPSAADRTVSDEADVSLKVKSVLRGSEEEVPRTDLPTCLIREMREQSIVDEAVGGGSGDAVLDASTTLVEPSKPAREYIPLLVDDDVRQKGRHNKRTMIANRAEKNIEEAVKAAAEAPVFAIDVDGAAFERMANSPVWVTNDESFKALLHTAPHGRREYYTSIRHAVQKQRRTKAITRFWLFSLRDQKSVLMSFFDGM